MVKTCNDPQDQETCTIIAVGMAVKLPIMMPGMDPAQFEQDGGTTFNSNDPVATTEEFAQAQKATIERAKKDAEAKQKQQYNSGGKGTTTEAPGSTTQEKAEIGEAVAHQQMIQNGYKPLGNTNGEYQPGQTGIDGVYEAPESKQPPKYVVVEAKYGKAKLGKTKDGKQMGDDWVTSKAPNRLEDAGLEKKQQKEIREGLKDGDGSVGKVVIRTNNKGEPKAKTVNSKGNIVRGNKGIYEL
jgi:hypothetical protein